MAGLVPAIHVLLPGSEDVDARDKRGHDGGEPVGMAGTSPAMTTVET